jgi:hypothetical protein
VEDLGAGPQRLGERGGADRHHHELLDVDAAVGVGAAVQDVHHRDREHGASAGCAVQARQVAIEWNAFGGGGGAGERHRDAEESVGAEAPLVVGPVQPDERRVDGTLVGVLSGQRGAISPLTCAHGPGDALAEIPRLVAVAELECLALAGRRAGGHGRPSEGAALERDLDFNGGIAARIENLAAVHSLNLHSIDLASAFALFPLLMCLVPC